MEAKTPQEFLDKVLPLRFDSNKAVGVDVVAQVDIAGPNGGSWVVTIRDQKLSVRHGNDSSAALSLKMAEKDFLDVVNGRLKVEKAFFTGKINFKGNLTLALKLREIGFL